MFNFREKFNHFASRPFIRDSFILQSGNIIATGISILTGILIARLLQPEKYGFYALVFSFAGLISLFMNLGSDKATITLFSEAYAQKDKEKIKDILTYFLKINILVSLSMGIITIIFAPLLSNYFYHSFEIGNLVRLILLTNILGLLFSFLTIIFQVLRQMTKYIMADILNITLKSIFSIFFVIAGLGVLGIVLSHLIVSAIALIISMFFYQQIVKRNDYLPGLRELVFNLRKFSVRKYFKFGFLIALNDNLGSLYIYLPMVFLGMFSSFQELAYFRIALKYVFIPMILLGPIAQLLNIQLPTTKTFGLEILKKKFIQVTIYSFLICALLIVFLVLAAPFLVKIFYGDSYLPTVNLIYYMAVFAALSSIAIAGGAMFRALNLMSAALKINLFIIFFGLPLVFFIIKNYGVTGAIFSYFSWPLLADIVSIIYLFNFLNKKDKNYA